MVIFEHVPLGLLNKFNISWYNYFVSINFSCEPIGVSRPHLILLVGDEILSLSLNSTNEFRSCWRITDALEELDTLFSLKIFQSSVRLEEGEFFFSQFHALKLVLNLSIIFRTLGSCSNARCNSFLLKTLFRNLVELLSLTSSLWSRAFIGQKGSILAFNYLACAG